MFQWLKKMFVAEASPTPEEFDEEDDLSGNFATETLKLVSVWDVVDTFLTENPKATPYSVHALIHAGATNLLDNSELLQVCDKIQEHGYQYPLNGTLLANLHESELLDFLRWQSKSSVPKDAYRNELTINELIERYRSTR